MKKGNLPPFTYWKNAWHTLSRLIGSWNLLDTLFADLGKGSYFVQCCVLCFPFPCNHFKNIASAAGCVHFDFLSCIVYT